MNHYQELIDHLESLCGDIRAAAKGKHTAAEPQTKQKLDESLEHFVEKTQDLVNKVKADKDTSMTVFHASHVGVGPSAVTIGANGQLVNAATGAPLGVDSGLNPGEVSTASPTGTAAPGAPIQGVVNVPVEPHHPVAPHVEDVTNEYGKHE